MQGEHFLATSETQSQPLLQKAGIALHQQEWFLIPTPVHAWTHIPPSPSFPKSSFSNETHYTKDLNGQPEEALFDYYSEECHRIVHDSDFTEIRTLLHSANKI